MLAPSQASLRAVPVGSRDAYLLAAAVAGDDKKTQDPTPPSPALTFSPTGIPVPTSPGIPAVTVEYPALVKTFNVTDQEALVTQHAFKTSDMQRLHNEQPRFENFLREQLLQMFADKPGLKPEDLTLQRRVKLTNDGSTKTLSSQPLLEALNQKVAALLANPDKPLEDNSAVSSDIFTAKTANEPSSLVVTRLSLDEVAQRIVTQFPKSLEAFWTTPRPTLRDPGVLESPQNLLLTLHKQQLSTLAAVRVSDGTLSAASKRLIDAALQHPTLAEREAAFADGARPGVYPLTVDDGTERGALLAGSFLLTSTDGSHATVPTWPKGRALPLDNANGPVVLYTQGCGYEEFATPALARQAIARRLDEGGAGADQLLQTLPLALQNRPEPPSGNDVMLSAEALSGDVLAEAIPWMLKRQQEETKAAFARSATDPAALNAIDDAADWSYLLSGDNAMAARDEKLADKLAPQWLKNLSPAQDELFGFLEHCEASSARVLAPLLEKIPALGVFSRDRMNAAIQTLYPSAQVDADKLMVQVHTRTGLHSGGQSSTHTRSVKNHQLPLTDLALKNPSEFPAVQNGLFTQVTFTLPLTDAHGKPILGADGEQVILDSEQLKAMVNTADVGGGYTQLLKQSLATDAQSGAAGEVRKAWKTNLSDMLDKEAFLAALNPDTYKADATQDTSSKLGAQWVAAVLDHPDPADRPQVDGKDILANALIQHGLTVQGVMVIGNATDASLVLCTPDAPDGVVFREVADIGGLNALMDKKEWRLYTASRKSLVNKDDVDKARAALQEYALDLTKNPVRTLDMLIKMLNLTSDPVTLKPLDGNVQDELYKQKVALVIDRAEHQSVSSAEVAAQSRINKVLFGVEVALIFIDLLPVVGKGASLGLRLGKAGVTALRANARVLPRLIRSPGGLRAIYSKFTLAASGIPNVSAAPLRPVVKSPVALAVPSVIGPAPSTAASQHLNLGAFAVSDDIIKGRPLGANGTYNVDGNWYVRFTDSTEVSRVYQIDSAFHARDMRVAIVDPNAPLTTPKLFRIKAFLQNAGNGEWRSSRLPGGAPTEPVTAQATKRPADPTGSIGQPAYKRPRVPESFPGEKALMEPPVKGKTVFYHYTGAKPHAAISASQHLESSSSKLNGEALPRGQGRHYFTDLAPKDMPTRQISETIFGKRKYGNALDKMTHYYEVNTSGLKVVQSPDNPHIFYVDVPFSIPLTYRGGPNGDLVKRVISHGKTPMSF